LNRLFGTLREGDPEVFRVNPRLLEFKWYGQILRAICGCLAVGVASLAIIAGFTRFDPGSSTVSQRKWTMLWLGFGILGPLAFRIFVVVVSPTERQRGQWEPKYSILDWPEYFTLMWWKLVLLHATPFFVLFIYGIPTIGGFVVVGQMLNEYGSCIRIP
jgi:hypothetical protein